MSSILLAKCGGIKLKCGCIKLKPFSVVFSRDLNAGLIFFFARIWCKLSCLYLQIASVKSAI